LFRFAGSFLVRFDTRTFAGLLFQEPPRKSAAVLRGNQYKLVEELLAEPPGVARRGVAQPALDYLPELAGVDQSGVVLLPQMAEAAADADYVAPGEAPAPRKQPPAEERDAVRAAPHLKLSFVDPQPQLRAQEVADPPGRAEQLLAAVAKQEKVIDVAEVGPRSWLFLAVDIVVEGIEIDVGKELGGLVANRQSPPAFGGAEEVVSGEVLDGGGGFGFLPPVEDEAGEPEGGFALDGAREQGLQNGVIDGGEISPDVPFEHVAALGAGRRGDGERGVLPLARARGEGVGGESRLPDGLERPGQGMVDDAVPEWRRGDAALF
jgi:hypothetical protein